jgi:hypothetical protein
MKIINDILNEFKINCNKETINKVSDKKLRNRSEGIQINDVIYYRLLYSQIGTTKEGIVSKINNLNNTFHSRQAFDKKDINISYVFYRDLFYKLSEIINNNQRSKVSKLIAVDGVCNNNTNRDVMTNLGLYNITNNIPIDIKYYGSNDRNNEVNKFIEYLNDNMNTIKNNNYIFVCDRLYFNYELLKFFIDNNLKFIVRIKGSGNNLDINIPLKKNTPKYDLIKKIRTKIRIIKCEKSYPKTVIISKKKMRLDTKKIIVKSDCMIVTNLRDHKKYTDDILLEHYNKRWDIEVFFKLIKNNFKFQSLTEKSEDNNLKMYYCNLIMSLLMKAINTYYLDNNKTINKINNSDIISKINNSNTIDSIFNHLLDKIIYNKLNKESLDIFCKRDIKIIKNKTGRSFPRMSKTPFTKWNIKGYSELSQYKKIVRSIINKDLTDLNKNLKMKAKRITIKDNG